MKLTESLLRKIIMEEMEKSKLPNANKVTGLKTRHTGEFDTGPAGDDGGDDGDGAEFQIQIGTYESKWYVVRKNNMGYKKVLSGPYASESLARKAAAAAAKSEVHAKN